MFFRRKNNSPVSKSLPALVSGLILFVSLSYQLIIIKPVINLPNYWYYPNVLFNLDIFGDWRQVQLWAKANTPLAAVFLVPPNWSGFRSFSERGIIADAKDGGAIFYSENYSLAWQSRMDALTNYQLFSTADFIKLQALYRFDYLIVTRNSPPLNLEEVYRNQQFSVYKM